MCDKHRYRFAGFRYSIHVFSLALFCLTLASCGFPHRQPRRAETELQPGFPQPNREFRQVALQEIRSSIPAIEGAEYINDDELCLTCHQVYTETFQQNVHRGLHQEGQSCEACHGPGSRHVEARGQEPGLLWNFRTMEPAQAAEVCLTCHEQNACSPGSQWRSSVHAHAGLSCTACHTAHYNVPPGTRPTTEPGEEVRDGRGAPISLASFQEPLDIGTLRATSNDLGAMAPNVCFGCHGDLQNSAMIAGPHQICGPNGFNCTTCHNSHGQILEQSRKDLCLSCHEQDSPTMAWHSSTHNIMGVACTDCHNPHPSSAVQEFPRATGVSFEQSNVRHPKRLPMSVEEPEACYKCHPKIYAMNALPSHHPVKEGKMVCSDCHDPHGQREGGLDADTKQLLCWKCHAEKQGPFAYEHPPVTEDCGYCHEPHGTVADNLLKQPTTFLCLRCHVGHNRSNHPGGVDPDIDGVPQVRAALYTDCTACHQQIHGSDLPSQDHMRGALFR